MKPINPFILGAVTSVLALGLNAGTVAAESKNIEQCYGVVKAGKNDCQTATSACAGTSARDGQKDAWVAVPKGTCEKLVNGSLKPAKG